MVSKDFFSRDGDTTGSNSLDVARDTFTWLVTGPAPLSIDGRRFPGLPRRSVALDELRDRLLARQCPQATRDAVWAHLVACSRDRGASWTVGAVGVALPALTSVAARLSARLAGDPAEVHAEVLRGFLTELSVIDLGRPRIMLRLRWAAYRCGHAALSEALGGPTPTGLGSRSCPPIQPWGHPDLVLARAVAEGVLTRIEADLIGATRLEEMPLADWARARGVGLKTTYSTRERAERRLVAYLRKGNQAAFEVLLARYESRLLSFCRHLLGSREDAEDVLQEVMTAAFNAILADDRPINVRPWLYRIARNRSLNHLRRVRAIASDPMDAHFSAVMGSGTVPLRTKELLALQTSLANACDYGTASETALAERTGATREQIAAVLDFEKAFSNGPACANVDIGKLDAAPAATVATCRISPGGGSTRSRRGRRAVWRG